jgi:hypothetical protein
MCLAMGSICTVGGREFAETLSADVPTILLAPMTKARTLTLTRSLTLAP